MQLTFPGPGALADLARAAVGQAVESAAAVATVPVRIMRVLGAVELLVNRMTVATDRAEALLTRTDDVVAEARAATRHTLAIAAQAEDLLTAYGPALRKAAPMAQHFVNQLTPEEVTAAIRLIDELPRLRGHLTTDVLPLLGTLERVGPDVHALLEVTRDLKLAVTGIPGFRMLRRRGEDRPDPDPDA